VRQGIHERLHAVLEAKDYKPSDVNAGRRYVAAYVQFIHFAEGLQTAAASTTEHDPPHAP